MSKQTYENSKFVVYGSKVWDIMYLNFLTLLCCLPIITAGASLTAMHYVLLRIYQDEDVGISRDFFHAFRRDFKTATLVWILYLAVGLALAFDYLVVIRQGLIDNVIFLILFYVIVFFYLFSLNWVFILLSRYRESTVSLIRDSFVIGTGYIFYTLVIMTLSLFPIFLLAYFPRILPLLLMFWLAGFGFLQTMLYGTVFKKCESTGSPQNAKPSQFC